MSSSSQRTVQGYAVQSTEIAIFNVHAQPITPEAFEPFGQVRPYTVSSQGIIEVPEWPIEREQQIASTIQQVMHAYPPAMAMNDHLHPVQHLSRYGCAQTHVTTCSTSNQSMT